MNLQEWLAQGGREHTAAALSRLSGISPPQVCKILSGKTAISLRTAVLIEKATSGKIRANEICADKSDIILLDYMRSAK